MKKRKVRTNDDLRPGYDLRQLLKGGVPAKYAKRYHGSGGKMKHRFTVIFEKEEEGGYHIFCPALPGCHTQSETIEEGIRYIHEAVQLYVESLVENGLPVPEEDILIKPIEITA